MNEKEESDKKQEANKVIQQIKDEHGEGSIMNLGEEEHLDVETISTGSLSLDHALGVGGIPRGKVVELFGKEASGKCLTGDTYIDTDQGLETIEELYKRNDIVPSCTQKVSENSNGTKVTNRYGDLEEVGEFVNNGRRKVFKVKTNSGEEVKCTANHPFLVINERGNWIWKKAQNLTDKDYVTLQRGHGHFGNKDIDAEKAYLIGVILADAHLSDQRIGITNDDPKVKSLIRKRGKDLIGVEPKEYDSNGKGSIKFHFSSKELVWGNFYDEFGYEPGVAKDKHFSYEIRTLNESSLKQVILGYMDSESYIDKNKNSITVTSASRELLKQLKLILQKFGIIGTLRPKTVKGYEDNNYYRLSLSGQEAEKYLEIIKGVDPKLFDINPKKSFDRIPNVEGLLHDLLCSSETTRDHYNLMGSYYGDSQKGTVNYKQLDKILDADWADNNILQRLEEIFSQNYYYDKVESVEYVDELPTFDLHMPESHSLVSDGMVTHNTTVGLHIIAEAQKKGGLATFIDAEHALDPKYSRAIGVDLDDLFLSQPNSGEESLEITEKLVRSSTMDVVVIDSVAALVPQAEIEGEMGDAQVGLQARLMSKAMRKLTSAIAQSKTTVVFINQIRSKINNSPWGPSTTTSGGRALKFYSSLRLNIYTSSTIENSDDEKIGNETAVRVVKNKVSPPFKTAEFDIMYGEGISRERELLDLGKEHGIVELNGAWYSYDGDNLGQGKSNAVEYLRDNEDVKGKIENKVKDELDLE